LCSELKTKLMKQKYISGREKVKKAIIEIVKKQEK
jgi:hypothetical protein